jgi:hypothetical protein
MANDPFFDSRLMAVDTLQATQIYNEVLARIAACTHRVISRTTATPPGSPSTFDAYVVPVGATGVWTGLDGLIVTYVNDWVSISQKAGMRYYVEDEGALVEVSGPSSVTSVSGSYPIPVVDDSGTFRATWDAAIGSTGVLILTEATVVLMAPLNMVEGRSYELHVSQDGAGSRILTYEAGAWATAGGSDFSVTASPNALDVYMYRGPVAGTPPHLVSTSKNIVNV